MSSVRVVDTPNWIVCRTEDGKGGFLYVNEGASVTNPYANRVLLNESGLSRVSDEVHAKLGPSLLGVVQLQSAPAPKWLAGLCDNKEEFIFTVWKDIQEKAVEIEARMVSNYVDGLPSLASAAAAEFMIIAEELYFAGYAAAREAYKGNSWEGTGAFAISKAFSERFAAQTKEVDELHTALCQIAAAGNGGDNMTMLDIARKALHDYAERNE